MPQHSLRWPAPEPGHLLQRPALPSRVLAALLLQASRGLARAARALAAAPPRAPAERQLEFYAEAGAPEGALFVDGELVGRLAGVRRL
ncbi:hypothetical protein V4F39_13950 [Aquincola sp. MAHUQ-54]|uniref:Uncharacterized protein n=1 Tax=Aquincola agrisoli TaxID=3119538 RepID=A0AAW9QIY6_9BURK